MPFDLRIFYSGLCVFAPIRNDDGEITEMDVYLVDSEHGKEAEGLERHSSVVQFALKNRWSDEPRFPLFTARDGTLRGLWKLDEEDVDVVAVDGDLDSKLTVDETEPASPTQVTDADHESFAWVIPLHGDDGKLGRIRPGLAMPFDDSNRCDRRVVARFRARAGRLFPASFNLHENRQRVQLWDFNAPGQSPRAVATLVEQRVRVDAPMVRLRARKFGEERSRFRYLTLKPSNGDSAVEVWVMNRELSEITHQTVPPPTATEFHRPRDREIGLCYRLLEPSPAERPAPQATEQGGDVKPSFFKECDDLAMRPFYFPVSDGELVTRPPCEPVRVGG